MLQTLKNFIWHQRRLTYLLSAGVLILLIYLISSWSVARNAPKHNVEQGEFLRIIEDAKRNRDDVLKKPFTQLFQPTVIHDSVCAVEWASSPSRPRPCRRISRPHQDFIWLKEIPMTHNNSVLFYSLAILDLRVGHTMDVLSPFISVFCHSDWLFHGESCPRLDVVHPGRVWSSSPARTWHCSLHHLFLQASLLFSHDVTIVC